MPIRPLGSSPGDEELPKRKLEPLNLDAGAAMGRKTEPSAPDAPRAPRKPEPLSLDAGAAIKKPEPPSLDAGAVKKPAAPISLDAGAKKPDGSTEGDKAKPPARPPVIGTGHKMPPVGQLRGRPLGRILIKMGKLNR